jgi:tetratricopeptide (TPR) repeat protein
MTNYYDLGNYQRTISTTEQQAQTWFDRGLMWCYAYNHEEAVRCFQRVVDYDPTCLMGYWGIGYAAGPNYNKPWEYFVDEDLRLTLSICHDAIEQGIRHLEGANEVEQALMKALVSRYQSQQPVPEEELEVWNDDYTDAMRLVYRQFPDDLDVATLFAEAIINRTPWLLWDLPKRRPAEGAGTIEAMEVLERGLQQVEERGLPTHPGLAHMYIHTMEMSPTPEKALLAADSLRELTPDAGHLLHMPSHIDVLCGHYHNAVVANNRAIVADNRYLQREGALNFYTLYRCHDFHFKIYAALFLGQYKSAIEATEEMLSTIGDEILRMTQFPMADLLESLFSMKMHVLIRFGKWREIVDEPLPADPDLYLHTTAMQHYARAIAYAVLEELDEADEERALFRVAAARVPEERYLFNNTCIDVLAIAAEMMDGEVEYRKGNYETAFAHLRRSVELDDNLLYAEPWGWIQPARHALGALLLEQGQLEEAEAVYRADLGLDNTLSRPSQHPDNVWSLHGYVECLHKLGKHQEAAAAQARLDLASARADVPITSSCFCRIGTNGATHDHCC